MTAVSVAMVVLGGILWAPSRPRGRRREPHRRWVAAVRRAADLDDLSLRHLAGTSTLTGSVLAFTGWLVFGNAPALVAGATVGALLPARAHRRRRRARRTAARGYWPTLIDELRVLTDAGGQSIPRALFSLSDHVPADLQPAFTAARREWLLTTDFDAALEVLRRRIGDPTVEPLYETLAIAHAMGGPGLSRRLTALADDRRDDLAQRQDAEAKLAGARFARTFVLIVPLGMAVAGLSVGTGRAAYATPLGQAATAAGLAMIAACWIWAGRVMTPPETAGILS